MFQKGVLLWIEEAAVVSGNVKLAPGNSARLTAIVYQAEETLAALPEGVANGQKRLVLVKPRRDLDFLPLQAQLVVVFVVRVQQAPALGVEYE
ncbi:Uncharacterised protein [uncultured archaeon]|nr:Uncharacterised protein [uncultured archaeon]